MGDPPRWVIIAIVFVLAIGLVAFARGRDHHRGDDVGAPSVGVVLVGP